MGVVSRGVAMLWQVYINRAAGPMRLGYGEVRVWTESTFPEQSFRIKEEYGTQYRFRVSLGGPHLEYRDQAW